MNFELTEDQKMVQEAAREFAQKRVAPIAKEMDEKEEVPREILKEMAELGYFGIRIPERYGGLDLDMLSYVLMLEELAKVSAGLMIVISVHNTLFCEGLVQFGSEELKQKYLPRMAKGELIGAYCLTEPGSGTDAGGMSSTAILKGGQYILNGTKSFVTNGGIADIFLVFALTKPDLKSKGISGFVVEAKSPGISLGAPEKKLGIKCSDTREISLSDTPTPKENLIGEENHGFKIALTILNHGRIGIGAQALGIAEAALEESIRYSLQRKQFGQPIANFQGIQFKLSDMAMKIEAARWLVYQAAYLQTTGEPFTKEASMAKLFASEMSNYVVNEAVQIHGGYGYMKEYAVERFFRDARITEIYEGTSEAQRIVISRELLKD
ncbi:MAG: acyl-CoA dehydrogenase [candidate division Zixibacteria bacterium RBG_16_50_21]|nr:MAG: acyl-CoA dehydrogenase [candidate division Zixibacteria bacterium RBG_16_50_21]